MFYYLFTVDCFNMATLGIEEVSEKLGSQQT
jgi:hypothetical protein